MLKKIKTILEIVGCCIAIPFAIAVMVTFGLAMVGIAFVAFVIVSPYFMRKEKEKNESIT